MSVHSSRISCSRSDVPKISRTLRLIFPDAFLSLAFAVEVGHEMLGALGEVEYGLKIYYFGAGRTDGAEVLRQQFEHTRVCLDF